MQFVNIYGNDLAAKYSPVDGYSYLLKDHLGSTRVVVGEDGEGLENYDYYPFGKIMRAYSGGQSTQDKFTGKEFDNDSDEGKYYFACPPSCWAGFMFYCLC